jgi:hypothetical protein
LASDKAPNIGSLIMPLSKALGRALVLAASAVLPASAVADYVTGLDPHGDGFLSFRTGPGTRYEEMGRLGPGTYVEVIGADGRWLRVRLEDGDIGWVFSRYVSPEAPADAGVPSSDEPAEAPSRTQQAESPAGPAAAMAGEWTRYENPRFGTVIDYPADLFLALPPPENGDGLSFKSVDDAARFVVFGQMNALEQTAEEMMADDLASGAYGQVTYQHKGTGWYVLSGYRDGNIYYRKVVVPAGGDTLHVFEIDYPPAQKAAYDSIAARMAKSLKAE